MYWISLNKLIKDISQDQLTERQSTNYYIAYSVVIYLATMLIAIIPHNLTNVEKIMETFMTLAAVGMFVYSIFKCFEINKTIDGVNFLNRFIPVAWVLSIQIFIGVILVVILTVPMFIFLQNQMIVNIVMNISMLIIQLYAAAMAIESFKKLKSMMVLE